MRRNPRRRFWAHLYGIDARQRIRAGGTKVFKETGRFRGEDGAANMGPHVRRATAATNALDDGADIAKVQEWLGHVNIATTRFYDHRKTRPEDSPTFKVSY